MERRQFLQISGAAAGALVVPVCGRAVPDFAGALTPIPTADKKKLALAYKNAMGELAKKYPDDLDAATLYAESAMNLRPWELWSPDGKPAEGTEEIIAVLESVLRRNPDHAGANHYYIHAVEASPHPERALAAADRLRTLQPGLAHNVHMPSHIDIRVGDWHRAIESNLKAIEAKRAELEAAANEKLVAAQAVAEKLEGQNIRISQKAGVDGRLFGSVTSQDIADAIKEARGITIDRRDIRLEEPIKTVGTRMVEVEVSPGVIATVKTMVTEDN